MPVDDEMYRGDAVTQKFTGGELSYDKEKETKAFTRFPPDLAGELAGLQIPDDPTCSDQRRAARRRGSAWAHGGAAKPAMLIGTDGLGQNFAGGKMYCTASDRSHGSSRVGTWRAPRASAGRKGDLGLPTSNKVDGGLATESRMSSFAAEVSRSSSGHDLAPSSCAAP